MKQQRIVCSALRHSNRPTFILGIRHLDQHMHRAIDADYTRQREKEVPETDWYSAEQGFLDNHGAFLNRFEAWEVAYAAGQILQRVGGDEKDGQGKLYSENIY